jgi:hypothetical protein
MTGIPSSTLRNIEAGLRPMATEVTEQLRIHGMQWDEKTQRWVFSYAPELPLDIWLIDEFHRMARGSSIFQDLDVRAMIFPMIGLLHNVSDADYCALQADLRAAMDELRHRYDVKGADDFFAQSAGRYSIIKTKSGSKHLAKEYSGTLSAVERLLDFMIYSKSAHFLKGMVHEAEVLPAAPQHEAVTQPAA